MNFKKTTNQLLMLTVLTVIGCSENTSTNTKPNKLEKGQINSTAETNSQQEKLSYKKFIAQVKTKKRQLKNVNQAKNYLFTLYNQDITNYWVGTKWDFNGVTRTPQQGKIACGYFVTNTLTDLGFNLQRVKLAQAPSSKMIKQLTVNIKHFSKINQLLDYIETQPNHSVYIVGLDFHTGFLLKDNNQIYFLHSTYLGRREVMKEIAKSSDALNQSKTYMLGSLTANDKLIKQWAGM